MRALIFSGLGQRKRPSPAIITASGPPIEAVIPSLPRGATTQIIDGQTYAQLGGSWLVWDLARQAWVVVSGP